MSDPELPLAGLYSAALRGLDGIERGTAAVPVSARMASHDQPRRIEALIRAMPPERWRALELFCEGLAARELAPKGGDRDP